MMRQADQIGSSSSSARPLAYNEVIHAIVLMAHFHAFSAFALGCGFIQVYLVDKFFAAPPFRADAKMRCRIGEQSDEHNANPAKGHAQDSRIPVLSGYKIRCGT